MADAHDASEAARSLANARWGDAVARRAAQVVIERAGQLPADLREQVHEATAGGEGGEGAG
jgi:hypothetical protein